MDLWRTVNAYSELKENMRHNGDGEFAAICHAARIGEISDLQVAKLNTRTELSDTLAKKNAPPTALWISPTNIQVNQINDNFYEELTSGDDKKPGYRIWAQHNAPNLGDAYPDPAMRLKLFQRTGGKKDHSKQLLPRSIRVAIGSRVALVGNHFGFELGLYSGSIGTVHSIAFSKPAPPDGIGLNDPDALQAAKYDDRPPIIFVCFDNYTGEPFFKPAIGEHWEADDFRYRIVPITSIGCIRQKLFHKYHRYQLPLQPAHASTVHRCQGRTTPVVYFPATEKRGMFAMALDYVAISFISFISLFRLGFRV